MSIQYYHRLSIEVVVWEKGISGRNWHERQIHNSSTTMITGKHYNFHTACGNNCIDIYGMRDRFTLRELKKIDHAALHNPLSQASTYTHTNKNDHQYLKFMGKNVWVESIEMCMNDLV